MYILQFYTLNIPHQQRPMLCCLFRRSHLYCCHLYRLSCRQGLHCAGAQSQCLRLRRLLCLRRRCSTRIRLAHLGLQGLLLVTSSSCSFARPEHKRCCCSSLRNCALVLRLRTSQHPTLPPVGLLLQPAPLLPPTSEWLLLPLCCCAGGLGGALRLPNLATFPTTSAPEAR